MHSKSKLVNSARQNNALTQNGAVTNSTSLNSVVDLFFIAGASRNMSEDAIIRLFTAARAEDKQLAYKCLFWARDIRGGAGERRFFQVIMKHLRAHSNHAWRQLYRHIPEYGYWKDFFQMTPNEELIKFVIEHLRTDGLCAKWMPRKGDWFKAVRRYMSIPPADLRHIIVANSKTVEQQMCANKWDAINYSHVPSIAFSNYKKAFERHDANRFKMFLDSALKGEVKVNAAAIFPYQIYESFLKGENRNAIEAQWQNLPNYVTEGTSFMPICDVSDSMTWHNNAMAMKICISLGVYLSERNKSVFKDAFITFSTNPQMLYLKGTTCDRFQQLRNYPGLGGSTNLQGAFELILKTALNNDLKQADLPSMLLVISDMEFNVACNQRGVSASNFSVIREKYQKAGYVMPIVVFWNVNGREGNVPVSASQPNVALVSGASPAIVKSVLTQKNVTPYDMMVEVLNNERYSRIQVE